MNARKALKLCSEKLIETERTLAVAQRDIKDYNLCIEHMINGGSPCDWCEEQTECQLQAKDDGKGCGEWWLEYREERNDGESQVGDKGTGEAG